MNEGDPRHPFLLALALTLLSVAGLMATQARPSAPGTVGLLSSLQTAPADTTGKERIIIEHVDLWRFDKEVNPDAQILTGNVVFKHDNALMYCDSALLYREANRFEAFGNVHIHQAQDTVDIYCNYLDYDGYTRLARLRELVQMEQGENTLLTDSLDYDRMSGIAYYFDYGSVADSLNVLSSVYAEYSTVDKTAVFYNDVVLQNDNFTLYSDTLHYDTNTKIATILGPTTIEGDSGIIYATRGTYRTEEDVATLLDRAEIVSGSRWMTGDSLIYDRPAHFADLYGSVILRDTAESMELRGNHVMYNDSTECGEAIDHAYIYEYSDSDHLFTGADRMQLIKVDSVNNIAKGVGNVRTWRRDAQAVADSMIYLTQDSVMKMYGRPFVWSGLSQVTGDSIRLFMKNGSVERALIGENAYMSQHLRNKYYNQMRGREVEAYFHEGEMDSVWTRGNAETIYFSENKDSIQTEQTHTQSSEILTQLENREVVRILLLGQTKGRTKPIFLVEETDLVYPDFVWFPEGRPVDSLDIFRRTPTPGEGGGELVPRPPTTGLLQDLPTPKEEQPKQVAQSTLPSDSLVTALTDSIIRTMADTTGISIDSIRSHVMDSLAVSLPQAGREILQGAADSILRATSEQRLTEFLDGRQRPTEVTDSLRRVGAAQLDSLGLKPKAVTDQAETTVRQAITGLKKEQQAAIRKKDEVTQPKKK